MFPVDKAISPFRLSHLAVPSIVGYIFTVAKGCLDLKVFRYNHYVL